MKRYKLTEEGRDHLVQVINEMFESEVGFPEEKEGLIKIEMEILHGYPAKKFPLSGLLSTPSFTPINK